MRRQAVFLATWAGRWTFKAAALVGAFVLIVVAWLWDASLLTKAADENLGLIKEVTRLVPSGLVDQGGERAAHFRCRPGAAAGRGGGRRQTFDARRRLSVSPPLIN